MYNKETIEYIFENRNKIIKKYTKRFGNKPELTEDLLSNIIRRLCEVELNVSYSETWLFQSMKWQYLNHLTMNKKYNYCGQEFIPDHGVKAEQEDKLIEESEHSKLYLAIDLLPETQKKAILNRMAGTHENTNTEKANYRHGLLKLREVMSEINYSRK